MKKSPRCGDISTAGTGTVLQHIPGYAYQYGINYPYYNFTQRKLSAGILFTE